LVVVTKTGKINEDKTFVVDGYEEELKTQIHFLHLLCAKQKIFAGKSSDRTGRVLPICWCRTSMVLLGGIKTTSFLVMLNPRKSCVNNFPVVIILRLQLIQKENQKHSSLFMD